MTHLGLIVAMGGHADATLRDLQQGARLDFENTVGAPKGAGALEVKAGLSGRRYGLGAYLALGPAGEDRQRGRHRSGSESKAPGASRPGSVGSGARRRRTRKDRAPGRPIHRHNYLYTRSPEVSGR
jgi:hypothetical protein